MPIRKSIKRRFYWLFWYPWRPTGCDTLSFCWQPDTIICFFFKILDLCHHFWKAFWWLPWGFQKCKIRPPLDSGKGLSSNAFHVPNLADWRAKTICWCRCYCLICFWWWASLQFNFFWNRNFNLGTWDFLVTHNSGAMGCNSKTDGKCFFPGINFPRLIAMCLHLLLDSFFGGTFVLFLSNFWPLRSLSVTYHWPLFISRKAFLPASEAPCGFDFTSYGENNKTVCVDSNQTWKTL